VQQSTLIQSWCALASLKLTLAALVFFAGGILYAYLSGEHTTLALVLPLALLSLNLMAAVTTNPVFRRSGPLLLFHLALVAIILLVAAGRLSYLKGHVELAEGEEFSGIMTEVDAGPWHRSNLDKLRFFNDGFKISYEQGVQRGKTRNAVRYHDIDGHEQHMEIGDQVPLVLNGYRFYTSPNKGFAPAFLWHPASGGEPMLGTVHLPSYPINEYNQAREWSLPGTDLKVWTALQFNEILLDPEVPSEFKLPQRYRLIVRIGELRRELQPGEAIELPQGRLVYGGLRTWMGYTVFYDWTIHWLLAACGLAVGALAWHFWRKFAARPWDA
jgi:hypothetical protein